MRVCDQPHLALHHDMRSILPPPFASHASARLPYAYEKGNATPRMAPAMFPSRTHTKLPKKTSTTLMAAPGETSSGYRRRNTKDTTKKQWEMVSSGSTGRCEKENRRGVARFYTRASTRTMQVWRKLCTGRASRVESALSDVPWARPWRCN